MFVAAKIVFIVGSRFFPFFSVLFVNFSLTAAYF